MSKLEDIDKQLLELSQKKDEAVAEFKTKAADLKAQREAAVAADKVAEMTDAERESLQAALAQSLDPQGVDSTADTGTPGGDK